MEIYLLNALSMVLSALIVTAITHSYRRKRQTRRVVFIIIPLIGSAFGLLLSSLLIRVSYFEREILIPLQFLIILATSIVFTAVFFFIQTFDSGYDS